MELDIAQAQGIAKSVKAYCVAAKVRDITGMVLEELSAAGAIPAGSAGASMGCAQGEAAELNLDLLEGARLIRRAGQLPYYTARAIGCCLAGMPGELDCETLAKVCGLPFEVELVRDIADAAQAARRGEALLEDPKRVSFLKRVYAAGYHNEKVYRGCAQCTLLALFEVVGHKDAHLFRITNTLASGMGLFGDGACGGYSGGLLFLGHYAGRRLEHIDGDKEEKDRCMRLCELLHEKFLRTYGSVICHHIHRDIFGRPFHIRRPDEKEAFEAAGAHRLDKCTAVVGTAALFTAQVLLDEGLIEAC